MKQHLIATFVLLPTALCLPTTITSSTNTTMLPRQAQSGSDADLWINYWSTSDCSDIGAGGSQAIYGAYVIGDIKSYSLSRALWSSERLDFSVAGLALQRVCWGS